MDRIGVTINGVTFGSGWNCCRDRPARILTFDDGTPWAVCVHCSNTVATRRIGALPERTITAYRQWESAMTTNPTTAITPAMEGCWFSGASNRTADELNVAVIGAALGYGWEPEDKAALEALNGVEGWFTDPGEAETASDAALDAESYLNTIAPEGYSFGFDEGFYLLPVCAWEWFEKGDDCPHGTDCPNVASDPILHNSYPHTPGMLYDCRACESQCFCDNFASKGECVHCAGQEG